MSEPGARRGFPLSLAQERFWFLDRLLPDIPLYNSTYAWRLRGPLDREGLERSLAGLVARHDILRTSFPLEDQGPVQRVDPAWRPELEFDDLTGDPEGGDGRLDEWLRRSAGRAFDLASVPPLRTALACLGPDDHALALVCHHVGFDGWSKEVVAADLARAYAHGPGAEPPPLALQYGAYATEQRAWLRTESAAPHRDFWADRLADAPDVLDLPGDRPRPASPSYAGDRLQRGLSAQVLAAASALARAERATPFMVFLTAFQALIRRYTGRDDFLVGVPVAVRQGRPELADMVGCFVNMIVIRADVSDDPTFRELLRRTRRTVFEAFPHQALPFEEVVEIVDPERSLSRNPLFQVLFNYRSYPGTPLALPGLDCREIPFHPGLSPLDLSLGIHAHRGGERLEYEIEYSSEQFDAATVERLASHYERLVGDATARPDAQVSDLALMGGEERRTVVAIWNDTGPPPRGEPVLDGIFRRARERPRAPAVEQGTRTLSYADLAARVGRVAAGLGRRGIGPGAVVGLFFDRTPDLLVAMEGVLAAGAAYLPLDAATPDAWLSTLARDAKADLVVADRSVLARVAALEVPASVSLDALEREAGDAPPAAESADDDLAYVIYTSGSTGRPKGVEISRGALSGFVGLIADEMELTCEDRVAQFCSIGFDVSGMEIHPTLARGATLVLRDPGSPPSASEFTRWLDEARITVAVLPTGYWHLWAADVARMRGRRFPRWLRVVVVIGEKAQLAPYLGWRERAGSSVRWINGYGPTEATIAATAHEPDPDAWDLAGEIPIGRPLPGYTTYVLDERRRPVPIGVPGELYLGGFALAAGYRYDPTRTAERFVPDPFGSGGRLYRTGDRARWRADGELEFLGRVDDQAKVRGTRVEPGQVEIVLSAHDDVAACAVLVREVGGEKVLVAYASPRPGRRIDPTETRSFLGRRLPDAMVPGSVVVLDTMPLSASGKIDRKALPAPSPTTGTPYAAPRSRTERVLARIWGEALEFERVGIGDDFFDLGGHSLIAARMLTDAEAELGASIPLAWIFEFPTIEGLARAIEEKAVAPPEGEFLVAIQARGERRPLFCVHGGGGGIFVYREVAEFLDPRQPIFGLMLLGRAIDDPPRTIEEMARRYLAEIRAVQPEGPYRIIGYSFGAIVAYEMACRLTEAGESVELLALLDASAELPRLLPLSRRVRRRLGRLARPWRRVGRRLHRAPVSAWPRIAGSLVFRVRGQEPGVPPRADGPPRPGSQASVFAIAGAARAAYRPRPYVGRIVCFRAESGRENEESMIWQRLARGGAEIRDIPGRHLTIMNEENAPVLARELQVCLDRLEAAGVPD